ncbi:MAG: ABC transporter substrate-binding protein [Clostridiaceae bacterium]|nr:ABC transporter substrate-binding protein [Clostridiaceae bacterium]
MKTQKRISAILAFILLVFSFAGCTNAGTNNSSNTPASSIQTETQKPVTDKIEVTDMAGRKITLDKPAEKIVVLSAADCEILYAIGAGDKLVGRGEYCDYPEEVNSIPSVESGMETNIEQIIALNPQVVIMSKMAQSKEHAETLEKAGIKVVVSDPQNIEGVYTAIKLIGTIAGKDKEADAVIDNMKSVFSDISAKADKNSGKTIYFEVSPLEFGLWTAGKGTFMDELAAMLGLTNAFSDVEGWAEISEEQVIERDPDYIVTIAMYFGEGKTPTEEIMGRSSWQNMKAIKNKAVLNVDSNEICRPGPRLVNALTDMYKFIYEN